MFFTGASADLAWDLFCSGQEKGRICPRLVLVAGQAMVSLIALSPTTCTAVDVHKTFPWVRTQLGHNLQQLTGFMGHIQTGSRVLKAPACVVGWT